MSVLKNHKLDPNFEQWLDQKIYVLKAEGVLESDQEELDQDSIQADDHIQEEDFVWGEEHTHVNTTTKPNEHKQISFEMSQTAETNFNGRGDEIENTSETFQRHLSTEIGKDYYQFVWEDDEEADVFDKEAYQLGHRSGHSQIDGNFDSQHRSVDRSSENEVNYDLSKGSKTSTSKLAQIGGIVLGVRQSDVKVSYTELKNTSKRENGGKTSRGEHSKGPDSRFSITDETDNLKLTSEEFNRLSEKLEGQIDKNDSSSFQNNKVYHDRLPRMPSQQNTPLGGNKGPVLPADALEMDMSSDEEILPDDFDVRSELAPDDQGFVTVDQATLVQQWRAKSKRAKIIIITSIGGVTILVFGLVVLLVVKLLQTTTF